MLPVLSKTFWRFAIVRGAVCSSSPGFTTDVWAKWASVSSRRLLIDASGAFRLAVAVYRVADPRHGNLRPRPCGKQVKS
jgi:hypothetical protein